MSRNEKLNSGKRLFEVKEFDGVKCILNMFIKNARKPQAFKPGDEWHPGAKPALAGVAEANR